MKGPTQIRSQTRLEKKKPVADNRAVKSAAVNNLIPVGRQNGDRNKPPSRRASRRGKRRKSSALNPINDESITEEEIPPPRPAWELFSEHVKSVSAVGANYSAQEASAQQFAEQFLDKQGSDQLKKILKDMKDSLQRKRLKELEQQRLREEATLCSESNGIEEENEDHVGESDVDSDDEEIQAYRRKIEAQRHWGVLRRDVQERIRVRKEKNPAGGTWNNLRAQLRAMTRGDNVRREIYERYGLVPRAGEKQLEDTMKPRLSMDVKELVNKFHSIQIKKLRLSSTEEVLNCAKTQAQQCKKNTKRGHRNTLFLVIIKELVYRQLLTDIT